MDDGTTRYLSGEFLDHGDNVISGTLNIRKDDSIEIKLNTDEALGTWKLQGDSLVITKKNLEKSEVFAVIDTGKEIVEYGLADRVIILKENVNGKIFRIDLCKNK